LGAGGWGNPIGDVIADQRRRGWHARRAQSVRTVTARHYLTVHFPVSEAAALPTFVEHLVVALDTGALPIHHS
jgi:hypothetical protein